jgi:mono/diheme cytochrome c family protein
LPALAKWQSRLSKNDANYEHHLLEALWVSWGLNKVDQPLLRRLLKSEDFRVRAAVVRAVRYNGHQIKDQLALLAQAASDDHGRVRLEAITAASRLNKASGLSILNVAAKKPLDDWMKDFYETAVARFNGQKQVFKKEEKLVSSLEGKDLELFTKGKAVFLREGFCSTCHQADGKGLPASGFPPLNGTQWTTGNEERFIKLVLNGLYGPIEVNGKQYSGQVPMTPFGGMLTDEEVAAVITYVRKSFGNQASAVSAEKVKKVREATKGKTGFYTPKELLSVHPLEN